MPHSMHVIQMEGWRLGGLAFRITSGFIHQDSVLDDGPQIMLQAEAA